MVWLILLSPFAAVGFVLAIWAIAMVAAETVRAARQSHRILSAHLRWSGQDRRATWREWFLAFVQDCGASYSETIIGPFRLNRDPSIKARYSW